MRRDRQSKDSLHYGELSIATLSGRQADEIDYLKAVGGSRLDESLAFGIRNLVTVNGSYR